MLRRKTDAPSAHTPRRYTCAAISRLGAPGVAAIGWALHGALLRGNRYSRSQKSVFNTAICSPKPLRKA